MSYNPTIIVGHLDDSELKKSIDALVSHVEKGSEKMATSFDNAVGRIESRLKELGNVKINFGVSSNVSSSQKTASYEKLTKAVKETKLSYDQMQEAMQKASGKSDVLEQYDKQLVNLRNRLVEVRKDIDIYNFAIGTGNKKEVSWGQEGLKKAKEEAEKLMATITRLEQQRGNLRDVLNPGKSFENYVASITKVNPELAALNAQYKNGTSLLQNQTAVVERATAAEKEYSETIRKQAAEIRASKSWQEKGVGFVRYPSRDQYKTDTEYTVRANSVIPLEEQLLQIQKKETEEIEKQNNIATSSSANQESSAQRQLHTQQQITQELSKRKYVSPQSWDYDINPNTMRGIIANKLGITPKEVIQIDETAASYNKLQMALKQVQSAYNNMTAEERNSPFGKALIQQYQEIQREAKKTQQTMSRPISFESAMAGTTKTLDEIAEKIQRLQSYKRGINLTDPKAEQNLKAVDAEINRLQTDLNKYMATTKQAEGANNALSRSWNYMQNRLAYIFTVGASTQFVRNLIEIRSEYEMVEKSLGILVSSAERGSQIFNELSQMALVSPYTLIELSNAAKQLTAYDVAAKDVVDTTRRLADMSSAVGAPVERLTYALGQIKAYGYLNARDARMFANAGIPLVKELAEYYTRLEGRLVNTADVYDRIKKKAVDYNDVVSVLNSITDEGGRFFDYQAKMADTLKVQLANLTLAWNNMLNDIGEGNSGILTNSIVVIKNILLNWKDINTAIKATAISFGALKAVQFAYLTTIGKVNAGLATQAVLGEKCALSLKKMGASMKALALNPWTWVFVGISALTELFVTMHEETKSIEELNNAIKENSKESSESIDKFLKLNKAARASVGSLSDDEAKKTWEAIREEIEKSSLASRTFVSELLEIENVNERVAKGFDYAEKIRNAQYALQNLGKDTIKVTQDWAWGLFGEGLSSDLKDYIYYRNIVNGANQALAENYMPRLERAEKEFNKELAKTANSIKNFLSAYNITDPLQVKEIVERIKSQIVAANPTINGEVRKLFDIKLDEVIFGNPNESLMLQFLDRLKYTYASAFDEINADWIRSEEELSEEQDAAINRTLEHFKSTMPEYASAIEKMIDELKESGKLRIRIATTFDVNELTEFQNEVNYRIKKAAKTLDFGDAFLLPTENESLISWSKRLQDSISSLEKENEKYALDNNEYSKNQIEKNKILIQQQKNLLDLFNQAYHAETKSGGSKKDIFGDALKKEIELISEMQKRYKEYVNMGVDGQNAMAKASEEYGNSIRSNNEKLAKYGVQTLNPDTLANMPIKDIRDFYKEQLRIAKELGNTAGIEALEKAIARLNVEITKTDYESITKGLNRALSDVKGEYEIAVDIQSMPELGQVVADMLGKSMSELSDMPRNWEELATVMQSRIDQIFADNALGKDFSLMDNLNMADFNKWVEANGQDMEDSLVKVLRAIVEQVNKVRQKETANQVESWNKLLEKYSDYEYKRKQIMETAERERQTAIKQGGGQDIINAINTREKRDLASLDFSQFQQSQEWIMATGDLATLTDSALGLLVRRLEEYKKNAKNLDPKQIKQINNAIKQLKREMRSGNPFYTIANAMADAKENAAFVQTEIDDVIGQLDALDAKRQSGIELTDEEKKRLKELVGRWQELTDLQDKSGKVNAKQVVSGLQDITSTVSTVTSAFGDMANAIGGENMTRAAETLSNITTILDKAAQGAAIGAQSGGGVWGAVIGGVVGGLMGAVTAFADKWSGNKAISESIQKSERMVKRLQLAYIDLERAIDNAYGTATIGAQKIANENKKLQLQELKRQLELEESRKSKNRDEDKIIELKGEIKELENEISDATTQMVNDLLGVSSVGDAMDNMMSSFIDALRSGEDAMSVFDESIDDMIANMVKKMFATKILQPWADEIWNQMQSEIESRGAKAQAQLQDVQERLARGKQGSWDWVITDKLPSYFDDYLAGVEKQKAYVEGKGRNDLIEKEKISWDDYKRILEQMQEDLEQQIVDATTYTVDDVKEYAEMLRSGRDVVASQYDEVDAAIEALGLKNATQNLSNLQQGIQGITEDTAGALEAYMNGVSQQVYLHTEILTQIRDAVTALNTDVNLSTQAQMLLQLQSNYQVMRSMESFMENWTLPSGNGIRVQLVS